MVDYYVNNVSGSNGNPGSAGSPWATITYAVTQVSSGDTINIVNTGTDYTDSFTVNAVSGTSANPIIIRAADATSPPTLDTGGTWTFTSSNYWELNDLIFDWGGVRGGAVGVQVGSGDTGRCTGFAMRRVKWRHGRRSVQLDLTTDCVLEYCHFQDIRTEIAGSDKTAVNIDNGADNMTIRYCMFEDIASDGLHMREQGTSAINTVNVHNCVFWINRPYGTSTRPWHTFSTNVGENGIDIKDVTGPIYITECLFYGFEAQVAGQDASGAEGQGIIIHNDGGSVNPVVIDRCRIFDCDRGVTISDGTGTTAGGVIRNTVIENCDDEALDFRDANAGVTVENCTINNCSNIYLRLGGTTVVDSIRNNLFANSNTYARGSPTGESNIDNNSWYNLTSGPPAQWVGGNDVTITTLGLNYQDQPQSTSDTLGAGQNLGFPRDASRKPRSITPAIGANEQEDFDLYETLYDGLSLYEGGSGTDSDTDHDIFYVPRNNTVKHALAVIIRDTGSKYWRWTLTSSNKWFCWFYIEPANLTMAENTSLNVLEIDDAGSNVAQVLLRYSSGNYQIRFRTYTDAGTVAGNQTYIMTGNGRHLVEFEWFGAVNPGDNNGYMNCWIDGTSIGSITGIDNDTLRPDTSNFGAQGVDAGIGGDVDNDIFYIDSLHIYRGLRFTFQTPDGSDPTLPQVASSDTGLVSYWKLAEVSGNALDSVGTNTLTETGGTITRVVDAAAVGGYQADFELADTEYFTITDAAQSGLDFSTAFTLVTKITPESIGTTQHLLSKWGTTGNQRAYSMYIDSSGLLHGQRSTAGTGATNVDVAGETTLAAATVYHVAVVYDGKTILIYVDGELDRYQTGYTSVTGSVFNSSAAFVLGARSEIDSYYDGLIEYAATFNRALSGAEIQYIRDNDILSSSPVYENDPNLVSYWKMGNNALDSIGSNHLTNNGASFVVDAGAVAGYQADFEFTEGDYMAITDAAQSGLDITTNVSVVARVTPESNPFPDGTPIIAAKDGAYGLRGTSSGFRYQFIINDGGGETGAGGAVGSWQVATESFLVGTYDGSNVKLYIDSVLVNFVASTITIANTTGDFQVGATPDGIDGLVDYVAVFNRVLTPEEIADIDENGIQPSPAIGISVLISISSTTPNTVALRNKLVGQVSINLTSFTLNTVNLKNKLGISAGLSLTSTTPNNIDIRLIFSGIAAIALTSITPNNANLDRTAVSAVAINLTSITPTNSDLGLLIGSTVAINLTSITPDSVIMQITVTGLTMAIPMYYRRRRTYVA